MNDGASDWQSWLDRHGAALLLLARQFVPAHADAEDIVQDAFIRFWRSRTNVLDPAAYLYACVKRAALDRLRAGERRSRREERAARPEIQPLFVSSAEQAERTALIQAALSDLPAEQSEVVVMKIWGGLSFPQIAEAIQISPNTAASRYRYALARLRGALNEEPLTEEPSYE
jgi:RNA polymerase sigma-70 factor (ECF subfamily)